jgi:anti-anti-sigma factor
VDLCDTTFLDSSGLRAVLVASGEVTGQGRRFAVACAEGGAVARLLELTGTEGLLSTWPDRASALRALRG